VNVEVGKHQDEGRGNEHASIYHSSGGIAIGLHQGVAKVRQHQDELDQLDNGDVLLPPTRLHILADGGQVVVGVHDHMDRHIEQA